MTVEEIFTTLAAHKKKGILIHEKIMEAYNFLGLKGYKKCHYYHYLEEINSYYYFCHYYMEHYHKLINIEEVEKAEVIPSSWYKYNQFSVDVGTKRNAIKDMMKQWTDWERATKELIQKLYKELIDLGELASADEFSHQLEDVSEELKNAERKQLNLETIGYDIIHIMEEQDNMYNKYKKKIKKIFDN